MNQIVNDPIRKTMWLIALVTFVVFDVATTWVGMHITGIHETSPIFDVFFERGDIFALFVVKCAIIAFIFSIDVFWYRIDWFGNFPFIPGLLIYYGTIATMNNIIVLERNGINEVAIFAVLAVLGYGTYILIEELKTFSFK